MLPYIWELIDTHADKRSTMKAIAQVWEKGSLEYALVEEAYDDSFYGHRKQWRHTGERYFRHILAVVTIIFLYLKIHDVELIIAAFLHDLVEDKPDHWTLCLIEMKYGKRVAKLVGAVTKPSYIEYGGGNKRHDRATTKKVISGGRFAVILKLADRLHNMMTLWGRPEEKRAKIHQTVQYFLPLSIKVGILMEELLLATAEQIQSSHIDDAELSEVGHSNLH